jgi:hypothetical protein
VNYSSSSKVLTFSDAGSKLGARYTSADGRPVEAILLSGDSEWVAYPYLDVVDLEELLEQEQRTSIEVKVESTSKSS